MLQLSGNTPVSQAVKKNWFALSIQLLVILCIAISYVVIMNRLMTDAREKAIIFFSALLIWLMFKSVWIQTLVVRFLGKWTLWSIKIILGGIIGGSTLFVIFMVWVLDPIIVTIWAMAVSATVLAWLYVANDLRIKGKKTSTKFIRAIPSLIAVLLTAAIVVWRWISFWLPDNWWWVLVGAVVLYLLWSLRSKVTTINISTAQIGGAVILIVGLCLLVYGYYKYTRNGLSEEEYTTKVEIEKVIAQEEVVKQLVACDSSTVKTVKNAEDAVKAYREGGLYTLLIKNPFPHWCMPEVNVKRVNLILRLTATSDKWSRVVSIPTMKSGMYRLIWSAEKDYVSRLNGIELDIKKGQSVDFTIHNLSVRATGEETYISIWLERNW